MYSMTTVLDESTLGLSAVKFPTMVALLSTADCASVEVKFPLSTAPVKSVEKEDTKLAVELKLDADASRRWARAT